MLSHHDSEVPLETTTSLRHTYKSRSQSPGARTSLDHSLVLPSFSFVGVTPVYSSSPLFPYSSAVWCVLSPSCCLGTHPLDSKNTISAFRRCMQPGTLLKPSNPRCLARLTSPPSPCPDSRTITGACRRRLMTVARRSMLSRTRFSCTQFSTNDRPRHSTNDRLLPA